MKEITKYECEFCGAIFDDEIECMVHELLEHDVKPYANEIHCWTYQGCALNFAECMKADMSTNDIAYLKCDSIQAVQVVIRAFDILGEYSPYEKENCPEGQELDLWYWPSDNLKDNPIDGIDTMMHWINLTYIRNEITNRMETIGIEERKI